MDSMSAVIFALVLATAPSAANQAESLALHDRIDKLIEQLGHDDYQLREQAQESLAKIGFAAYDRLVQATEHEDLEIACRSRYLVRLIRIEWAQDDDPEEVKELLSDYESQDFNSRAERIQRLAYLPSATGIAALCRVVRFEPSDLLSKFAASEILIWEPPGRAAQARWAKALADNLGQSPQLAAGWLLVYLQLRQNPEETLTEWLALVNAEREVANRSPNLTSPVIVSTLMYRLAAAQSVVGDKEAAGKTATETKDLYPADGESQQESHLQTASALQRQGHFGWAALEYELVGDTGWSRSTIRARERHAEMLHDQGRNLEAAEVLNKVFSPEDKRIQRMIEGGRENLGGLRARMKYFRARHWEKQGDEEKYRRYLDEALEAKPDELDTLIACYQLPAKTPEFHHKIVGLIEQAVDGLQEQIDATDDGYTLAHLYNQYAWLVGNTEGNTDLTLEYAQKAAELVPDSGAYLDTLAHVYYGRGDYGNAVKYQLQALELDPHSGLLQEKLAVFRKALQEKQETPRK